MNNYKSPINIISSALRTEIENETLKAIKDVGIDVDKDELIKALTYDRQQYEKGFSDATPKWISVNERLPKEGNEVIVTIKDDSADSPIYYTSAGWYYEGIWVVGNEVCYQVIAWMPFPDPYKDGEQK